MEKRPLWFDTAKKPQCPVMPIDKVYDVIVVGAGITGITTALLLAESGIKPAVFEANEVGSGTSGHTTAKITVQHGVRLSKLSDDKAAVYHNANMLGFNLIKSYAVKMKILCDYETQDSYLYALNDEEERDVAKESAACERLGIETHMVFETPLPYKIRCALVLKNQAQFHPLKYLYALAAKLISMGVPIHEKNKALAIERDERSITVVSEKGPARANAVVLATGYPMLEFPGTFFLRLHQQRSYLAAVRQPGPNGMFINAGEPVRSVRSHTLDGIPWLLAGGFGHRTGKEDGKDAGYEPLETFLNVSFSGAKAVYGWSAQDGRTLDHIPYIGGIYDDGPQVYVAAGYDKWGMTNSAAAALMIADDITGGNQIDKEIKSVFSPKRFSPVSAAGGFIKQAAEAAYEFTAGNASMPAGSLDDIEPGTGAVIRLNGKALAVYKDENGHISAFKAHCTHLGCPLEYNRQERSFDCACHGSRFSMTGDVIEGPAIKPLTRADAETGL